jgi:hypothetical protein
MFLEFPLDILAVYIVGNGIIFVATTCGVLIKKLSLQHSCGDRTAPATNNDKFDPRRISKMNGFLVIAFTVELVQSPRALREQIQRFTIWN